MSIDQPQPRITVPSAEVHTEFAEIHSQDELFNRYGLFNVQTATEAFGDTWVRRLLSQDEIMNAVLPSHQHPAGEGEELVPYGGLTVEQTAKRLGKLDSYGATNPNCFQRLQFLTNSQSPLYLSVRPIPTDYYSQLDHFTESGHLFHLDGLHRLVARAAAGLVTVEYLAEKPVVAYIAGEA